MDADIQKIISIDNEKYSTKANDENYDNREGIMLAIKDAIEQGINSVFIPSGTWYISVVKPIYIPSNFTLYGIGNISIIKAINSSYSNSSNELYSNYNQNCIVAIGDPTLDRADGFVSIADHGFRENIKIHDICIDGNIIDGKPTQIANTELWVGAYGLACIRVKNLVIENCYIKNTLNTGILFERNSNTTVDNCIVTNCGIYGNSGSSRNGISMVGYFGEDAKATRITNCDIHDNGDVGIQYVYAPLIITNCHIYNNVTYGIEGDNGYKFLETVSNNIHGDVVITGNYLNNNGLNAINITQGNNQKVTVVGNTIKNHQNIIAFSQSEGGLLNFVGNNISYINNNSSLQCITLTCNEANISNNIFDNCISTTSGFCSVTNNTTNLNINNNIMKNIKTNKLIVFRGGNLNFTNNQVDLSKYYCNFISLWDKVPETLKINNNTVSNLTGVLLQVPSSIDNFTCNYLSINNNLIYDCNSPSSTLIYIVPTTLGNIKIFELKGNSLGMSDPSYKIGRFLEGGSNLIIDYFCAFHNYIPSSLNLWGDSFKFSKKSVITKINNNYFNANSDPENIDISICNSQIETILNEKLKDGTIVGTEEVQKLISDVSSSDISYKLKNYYSLKDLYTSNNYNGAIITFIDDDGTNIFYNNYAAIFRNNNIRCSLGIITGNVGKSDYYMSLDKIKKLQDDGFDILSHSNTHEYNIYGTDLMKVSDLTIENDMKASQEYMINNGLNGYDTLVWPYGAYDNYTLEIQLKMKKIARKYFKNAINSQGGANGAILDNMLIGRIFLDKNKDLSYFQSLIDKCLNEKTWLIFGSHCFSSDSITTDYLDSVIKYVISKGIPIMTFSDGIRLKENKISIGDKKDTSGRIFIGNNGSVLMDALPKVTNYIIEGTTGSNGYALSDAISKYPTGISTLIVGGSEDTVTNGGGFLTTYNVGQYNQMYQEFVSWSGRRKFIRGWNGTGWDSWSEFQARKLNYIAQYYTGKMDDPISKYNKNQVTVVQLSNTLDTLTSKGGSLETFHGEEMLSHQKFVNLEGRFFIRYWSGLDSSGYWSKWKEVSLTSV